MSVPPSLSHACHCINPNCWQPYPQTWGQKSCQTCGATLHLNTRYIPLERLRTSDTIHVYSVYDRSTGTERILRVLVDPVLATLETFHRQAVVLASLYHRGLPRVEVGGYFKVEIVRPERCVLPCLVTEKMEGLSLEEAIAKNPKGCAEAWVLDWLKQAVVILEKLHKRHVFHGHLTPASLVLRRGGGVQQLAIADLGFPSGSDQAESTQPFEGYMPPEQRQTGAIGPTADLYALGRICIHLLTGRNPALLDDPATKEPRWRQKARVSAEFANLLDRLVHPAPHRRPASAADVLDEISRIPVKPRPSRPEPQTVHQSQPNSQISRPTGSGMTTAKQSSSGNRSPKPVPSGMNGQPKAAPPPRRTTTPHPRSGGHATPSHPVAGAAERHATVTPTLMSASRYQAEPYLYSRSARLSSPIQEKIADAIAHVSQAGEGLLQASVMILRIMVLGCLGGSLAAAIGFWVTYWSPLKSHLDAFFAYQLSSPYIPLVLLPAMLVFGFAGMGTTWALTLTRQVELDHQLWKQRFMGGLGYAIAWMTWQWATPGIPLEQAIARLTSVTALGLVITLGSRHNLITQAIVVVLGTYMTFTHLVGSTLWKPGYFLNLFPASTVFNPNEVTFWATVNFFGLLGLVLSFWMGFSYFIAVPMLERLGRR